METRQLGASSLHVTPVAFGAWAIGGWLWGGADEDAAVRAIQRAIDVGMTTIDTAATYGFGRSESIVGKAIRGRREEVIIATKCGVRWDLERETHLRMTTDVDGTELGLDYCLTPESIRYEVENSLRRLGIDVIDLYQAHWPDPDTPIADSMGTLLDLTDEGKIRAIGVSNYSTDMMADCLELGPLASSQPKYNPLERDIEADVLPFCREHNIGVLAYSPIAQGLMTGKVTPDRIFADGDHRADKPWFSIENRKRILAMLETIQPIADGHNATLGQVATNWVISQPGITSALVGARTPEQVEENAGAMAFQLTGEELKFIRDAVEALGDPV